MHADSFGPWTTGLAAGSRLELSSFWSRRLSRLKDVREGGTLRCRRSVAGLILVASLTGLMPTLLAVAGPADTEAPNVKPAAPTNRADNDPSADDSEGPDEPTVPGPSEKSAASADEAVANRATIASKSGVRLTPQVRAIRRVLSSVVDVSTERLPRELKSTRDSEFIPGAGGVIQRNGTGLVIDERGYILTNQSVVENASTMHVTLDDGSKHPARIISFDRSHDLAVVKIDLTQSSTVAPMGTSSDVMIGETVIAIATPFGSEKSIAAGLYTGTRQRIAVNTQTSFNSLLQIDIAVNSGGGAPVVNLEGEVIGITVAARDNAQRVGFAVPIDDARKYLAKLLDTRQLNETWHGLATSDVKTPEHRQLVVDFVEAGSPASSADVRTGDVVAQVDTLSIVDRADLERSLIGKPPGTPIEVTVQRNGERMKLTLQLARTPEHRPGSTTFPKKVELSKTQDLPAFLPTGELDGSSGVWRILGLRLKAADSAQLELFRRRYRGGLEVTEVSPDGPAALSGITVGDVLVGLGEWETTRHADIEFILKQPKFANREAVPKFYVIRRSEVLYGPLKLKSRSER